jgi:hypothetical protein
VSLSNGSSFTGFGQWTTGHGSGSSNQLLGDITGDGKADAVAYFGGTNGWWYDEASSGSAFGASVQMQTGYGVNSSNQLVGDVNGDGKADAIIYEGGSLGNWYVELSNGSTLGSYSQWKSGFGVGS